MTKVPEQEVSPKARRKYVSQSTRLRGGGGLWAPIPARKPPQQAGRSRTAGTVGAAERSGPSALPGADQFEGPAGGEYLRIRVTSTDDLQPHGQLRGSEPARDARRGLLSHVERITEPCPGGPPLPRQLRRRLQARFEGRKRCGRGEQKVVLGVEKTHLGTHVHPQGHRREVVLRVVGQPFLDDLPQPRIEQVPLPVGELLGGLGRPAVPEHLELMTGIGQL